MEKQQGGPVARAAQPLPLYNVGLNYAGVSIKHVTFYQDLIVWQYFTFSSFFIHILKNKINWMGNSLQIHSRE